MGLSKPERELLIRLGLGANELLLFQRLWGAMYYRSDSRSEAAQAAHAVQIDSMLLMLIGKLFEACENVNRFFLCTPVAKEYLPKFTAKQRAAVEALKKLRGDGTSNKLLADIRNNFSFHFHHKSDLSGFIGGVQSVTATVISHLHGVSGCEHAERVSPRRRFCCRFLSSPSSGIRSRR